MKYSIPLKPRIILLNGPPRCGKDTVGEMLAEKCRHVSLLKFAQPLIDGMNAIFGVSCDDGQDKMKPCDELFGDARRPVSISLSEEWMKLRFGSTIFGKIALRRIQAMQTSDTIVMTDSGFRSEADVLLSHYSPKTVELVRISRPGCDFTNDSRSYWRDERATVRRILNDGSLDDLEKSVDKLLDQTWRL